MLSRAVAGPATAFDGGRENLGIFPFWPNKVMRDLGYTTESGSSLVFQPFLKLLYSRLRNKRNKDLTCSLYSSSYNCCCCDDCCSCKHPGSRCHHWSSCRHHTGANSGTCYYSGTLFFTHFNILRTTEHVWKIIIFSCNLKDSFIYCTNI
jgi:hypothetical protein